MKADNKNKIWIVRIVAIVIFITALAFTLQLPGTDLPSTGESVFEHLGLSVYSEGTEGWYFPGIVSLIGQFIAIVLFSITTTNRLKTLNSLLSIYLIVVFITWILI